MKKKCKEPERQKFLKSLEQLSSLSPHYRMPHEGWIRTLRKTLGMTTSQLAKRLNVQQSRVCEIERGEIHHQLTLKTLRNVAKALGCRFEYAFIPEQPVEFLLKEKALSVARKKVEYVSSDVIFEGESLSDEEKEEQIKQLAEELLIKPERLWD